MILIKLASIFLTHAYSFLIHQMRGTRKMRNTHKYMYYLGRRSWQHITNVYKSHEARALAPTMLH